MTKIRNWFHLITILILYLCEWVKVKGSPPELFIVEDWVTGLPLHSLASKRIIHTLGQHLGHLGLGVHLCLLSWGSAIGQWKASRYDTSRDSKCTCAIQLVLFLLSLPQPWAQDKDESHMEPSSSS